jgi:NAD(P)-dependent dehydrogenase (short-subunit alcohol dehydrogenase family)
VTRTFLCTRRHGRVVLVTGGTGWLGSAFCEALAEAGATVVVSSSTSIERAQASAAALPCPRAQTHHAVQLDHMDEDSIVSGFRAAVAAAGAVDCLVNNGLAAPAAGDVTNTTFQKFSLNNQNNAGYFVLARELRDHLVSRGVGGNVVNIGSMYGQVASYPDAYGPGAASPVAYHALKGGTIHMTRHMAAYWAADQVRVNCLSPGTPYCCDWPHSGRTVMLRRGSGRCLPLTDNVRFQGHSPVTQHQQTWWHGWRPSCRL